MATPIALILGAGPRVGASVAASFAHKGYKVAVASRNGTDSTTDQGHLSLKADLAHPESIPALFDAVKAAFGAPPNAVVYNAASLTPPPNDNSVLSIPAEKVTLDLNINTISPYVAAQQAVAWWETLPANLHKTFIYTGNALNVAILPVPDFLTLGVGKSASAYWIGTADALYKSRGYR
jgi:NAD(P)-dependent dehydrogenase (short-subunit alcohol dehydrogenase family)